MRKDKVKWVVVGLAVGILANGAVVGCESKTERATKKRHAEAVKRAEAAGEAFMFASIENSLAIEAERAAGERYVARKQQAEREIYAAKEAALTARTLAADAYAKAWHAANAAQAATDVHLAEEAAEEAISAAEAAHKAAEEAEAAAAVATRASEYYKAK